MASTLN